MTAVAYCSSFFVMPPTVPLMIKALRPIVAACSAACRKPETNASVRGSKAHLADLLLKTGRQLC